ncbi:hypothetical protein MRQ47_004449 [Salmonella enterica]|nr:hypothetical protein [Salmonella enterica]
MGTLFTVVLCVVVVFGGLMALGYHREKGMQGGRTTRTQKLIASSGAKLRYEAVSIDSEESRGGELAEILINDRNLFEVIHGDDHYRHQIRKGEVLELDDGKYFVLWLTDATDSAAKTMRLVFPMNAGKMADVSEFYMMVLNPGVLPETWQHTHGNPIAWNAVFHVTAVK